MKTLTSVLILGLSFHFIAEPAFGYLEPGSGSLIIQILLGFFTGFAVFFRQIMAYVRQGFQHFKKKSDNE